MANPSSSIEWTDATWSPTTGCDRVSAGCDSCYALSLARRLKAMGKPHYQNDGNPETSGPGFGFTMHADRLSIPFGWRKPKRVFVDSMSDLFHADASIQFLAQVFAVMAANPQHTFQILTKRPQKMSRIINGPAFPGFVEQEAETLAGEWGWCHLNLPDPLPWPLPNVSLGVSVESQDVAWRIDWLVKTPAAVRFLSCEPLLGPLDLSRWLWNNDPCTPGLDDGCPDATRDAIHWVIAGGESGPRARPMHPDWARSLRDQCLDAHVAFFFKQWGEWAPVIVNGQVRSEGDAPAKLGAVWWEGHGWRQFKRGAGHGDVFRVGKHNAGRLLDGRTWDEFPEVRA